MDGDEFATAAAEDQIKSFGNLHEKFDTRRIGMIGAAEHYGQRTGSVAQICQGDQ